MIPISFIWEKLLISVFKNPIVHVTGILVFIGMFGTFFHVNSTIKKQVALKVN